MKGRAELQPHGVLHRLVCVALWLLVRVGSLIVILSRLLSGASLGVGGVCRFRIEAFLEAVLTPTEQGTVEF